MKKISKIAQGRLARAQSKKEDVIEVILEDHKPLKRLIKVLKDADATLREKKPAFLQFVPLLLEHAQSEEKTLYVHMKMKKTQLREDGHEGDTEHEIASELIAKINRTRNKDSWMAKTKVLAELVEHHIEEEEEEIFKHVRKTFDLKERAKIGREYLSMKAGFHHPQIRMNKALDHAQSSAVH